MHHYKFFPSWISFFVTCCKCFCTHFGHVTKIKISLNILLKIIDHNNRLLDHLFFYRLWPYLSSSFLLSVIVKGSKRLVPLYVDGDFSQSLSNDSSTNFCFPNFSLKRLDVTHWRVKPPVAEHCTKNKVFH